MKIELEFLGIIKTPFEELEGMPIQPVGAKGVKGQLILKDEFKEGLKDLEGFSHIEVLYLLHKVKGHSLEVKPFLDDKTHGVFATRSPKRPNRIGASVIKVTGVEDNIVHVENVDMLNGTPILDIKPFVPHLYDGTVDELKIGWFEDKHQDASTKKADDRFIS